jgi:hypothetical protein
VDPITIALIGFAIIAFVAAGIIKLIKGEKAKKHLAEADEALKSGDDKTAILSFKRALNNANENPEKEAAILAQLEVLYKKHGLEYDLTDFHKLTDQFKILKKKSSNKALRGLTKTLTLKKQIVKKLPEL